MIKYIFLLIIFFHMPIASAQEILWDRVMGASVGKLTAAQKIRATEALRTIHNYYGCSRMVADCLKTDPKCETARRLAGFIVRLAAFDRSVTEIKAAVLERSRSVHPLKTHKIAIQKDHCLGDPAVAKVNVVVFGDVLCPFCAQIIPMLHRLVKSRGVGFSICFKHFPTTVHEQLGVQASEAMVAAALQGKGWEFLLAAYPLRREMSDKKIIELARTLKLDLVRLEKDRISRAVRRVVASDKREGLALGIAGTPQVYVNGKEFFGRKDEVELADRLDEELMLKNGGK
ncbi:DsbA family protein [Myxococcota bacterium]|nr:DsbA family protein [Myxococcota bacterium]